MPSAGVQSGVPSVRTTGYGRPATLALRDEIRRAQSADPLAAVTVIVPSNLAGLAARRVLGADHGLANVSFLTPYALAERLGRPGAAAADAGQLSEAVLVAAIRMELRDDPGMFAAVAGHSATERALAVRYSELSRARPETLARIRRAGSARAQGLIELFERVRVRLAGYADEDALARHAQRAVEGRTAAFVALGTVVVHLPQPLPPALVDLVRAVIHARPSVVVLGGTGDPLADDPIRRECERLGVTPVTSEPVTVPCGTEIISASDVDEEVRAVTRRILELAAAGVPFDRMAVLGPAAEPYARTIASHLQAAGIPHNGPAIRTLADTMAGRMLDRLVRLVGAQFARDEVVALFASTPARTAAGGAVPIDRWDRISRRAGIVDGDDWSLRLAAHIADLESRANDRVAAGVDDGHRLRREARAARELAEYVADLRMRLGGLEQATGWAKRADASRAVLLDLLGGDAAITTWPGREQEASIAVLDVLDRCAQLDAIEPDPAFATFASAVTAELRTPVGRIGRYGQGVLCGTITTGLGLDLDAVFVLGVAEGMIPSVRREDALIAETDRVLAVDGELRNRERSVADQRRAYLATLAAGADHRILSFARGDLRTTRDRLPSRFLLETASALRGSRVFASDFDELGPTAGVDVVASFPAGLRRVAAAESVGEHDLGLLVQATDAGADVARHPLTAAPSIAAGIEARRARASSAFTRWDGNVAAVAARVPSPATGEVVSATRLEQWSTCPFRYFLAHVLRVPVEDEPERLLELSPLDRGTLVHAILERFVAEELAKPESERVPPGLPWPMERSVVRLVEILDEAAADAEARGLTGKAVLWSLHREEIASEVVQFLLADNRFRMDGSVPESVEFPFGFEKSPPVEITVPSGAVVRFRGRADRIDRRPDGTRVVLDYKTGMPPRPKKGPDDDPVWAGGRLQLPLYAEAARQALGAEQVEAAYWYVSARGGFGRDQVVLDDATSTRFREVVGQIVDGIDGGTFPASPGAPSWFHGTDENCAYCDFNELCPVDRGAQYDAKESAPEFQVFHDLTLEPHE